MHTTVEIQMNHLNNGVQVLFYTAPYTLLGQILEPSLKGLISSNSYSSIEISSLKYNVTFSSVFIQHTTYNDKNNK